MTAFARTMRCARVDGVTRNARAISSVVRPQTSRATCPSGGRGDGNGKDETEAVVLDFLILVRRLVEARLEVERAFRLPL